MGKVSGAALAALLAVSGTPALAQDDGSAAAFHATTLSLSGEAEVRIRPDLALVAVGVQVQGSTAAQALARNRDQMAAVVAALRGLGVVETDIQTSTLQLNPRYADDAGREPQRLTGYQASNDVTVRLHDMTRIGAVLDALVAAGANQIQGVRFDLDDPGPSQDAARRAAVKALQAKAELYAGAAGYRLQRLVRLSEFDQAEPRMAAMARLRVAAPTPVEPGELTIHAQVQGEYELSR